MIDPRISSHVAPTSRASRACRSHARRDCASRRSPTMRMSSWVLRSGARERVELRHPRVLRGVQLREHLVQRFLEAESSSPVRLRSRGVTLPVSPRAGTRGSSRRRRSPCSRRRRACRRAARRTGTPSMFVITRGPSSSSTIAATYGHALVERRQVVHVHDRVRVERAAARRFLPRRRRRSSTSGRTGAGSSGRGRRRCSGAGGTCPPCSPSQNGWVSMSVVGRSNRGARRHAQHRHGFALDLGLALLVDDRAVEHDLVAGALLADRDARRQHLAGPGLLREPHPVRLQVADRRRSS